VNPSAGLVDDHVELAARVYVAALPREAARTTPSATICLKTWNSEDPQSRDRSISIPRAQVGLNRGGQSPRRTASRRIGSATVAADLCEGRSASRLDQAVDRLRPGERLALDVHLRNWACRSAR
jgi:hypothetical protein